MTSLLHFIKQLFVNLFKLINYTRLFILNLLFFTVIAIIVLGINLSVNEQKETIKIAKNSYLRLNLNGFIVEQKHPIDLSQQISNQLSGAENDIPQDFEVQNIIDTLKYAQEDPKITGLILELGGLRSGSLGQLTDIGNAINAFKAQNKKVYAYSDNYTQSQYYLAAYADEITLAPNGVVILQGYSVNRLYFKQILDNLLITPHIFKVGTYKSFVEPFTETKMSSYSKEANLHWLNQLWEGYIENVLLQRQHVTQLQKQSINPDLKQLKKALLAASGDTGEYALTAGLVDKLAFYEQFIEEVQAQSKATGDRYNSVNYQAYSAMKLQENNIVTSKNKVAVIYGTGEIISGYSDTTSIADKSFNALIKKAIKNPNIKAVVLRLDTPGGSAFASENIRQQVLALKNAGKKVTVSMGATTASGGYWIASAADRIIAEHTTLTGSIGIFGMFATIDKSLNKLGVYQDGVSTSDLSNVGITQPLNPELAEIFQIGIENGYANFLKIVAEGRHMSIEQVDKVAQGRVWTGEDALSNGLVDQLGNLQLAISVAAELASINDFNIITIKPDVSPKQAFINQMFSEASALLPALNSQNSIFLSTINDLQKQANFATRINDPQNRFVYCTMCRVQ